MVHWVDMVSSERMRVTREGPVPLHSQIRAGLLGKIEGGELRPGDRAPSERELSDSLGVSRMTARAALSGLVKDGYMYTVSGKGTFVANPTMVQDLVRLTSYTEDMQARGLEPGGRVVEFFIDDDADATVYKKLGLGRDEQIVRLTRLRTADEEPMCIETSYLPRSVTPWLLEQELNDTSLYEMLRTRGINLRRAEEFLEATLVSDDAAHLLAVAPGSPALLIRRITYSDSGAPVEYVRSLYRGDRYVFHTGLSR